MERSSRSQAFSISTWNSTSSTNPQQPPDEETTEIPVPPPTLLRSLRHKLSRRSLTSLRRRPSTIIDNLHAIPEDNFTPAIPARSSSRQGPQQLRHRASFRERFWTKPAANVFDDDDALPNGAKTQWVAGGGTGGSRTVWVPTHAASDFSRLTFPLGSIQEKGGERSGGRIRPLSPIAAEGEEEGVDFLVEALGRTGVGGKGKGKAVGSADGDKPRRQVQRHSYTIAAKARERAQSNGASQTQNSSKLAASQQLGPTVKPNHPSRDTKLPGGSDFQNFMAQARNEDREHRARLWNSLAATTSQATPVNPILDAPGRHDTSKQPPQRVASSVGTHTTNTTQDKANKASSPERDAKESAKPEAPHNRIRRQASITQRIAEYIRPPVGGIAHVEPSGTGALRKGGLRGEYARGMAAQVTIQE